MSKIYFFGNLELLGSARCRGWDIAQAMGTLYNPSLSVLTKDDVAVMVKMIIPDVVAKVGKAYCDIVDGHAGIIDQLEKFPEVGILTMTELAGQVIKEQWNLPNSINWIPHSHCNDENDMRKLGSEVKVITYQGYHEGFERRDWDRFVKIMRNEGFTLIYQGNPVMDRTISLKKRRLNCCRLYKETDISVSFRINQNTRTKLKGPTKLNNAGSFGIPLVAFPEPGFDKNINVEGSYLKVSSIEKMAGACIELRNKPDVYCSLALQAMRDAKQAHISNIVKWYERLL